MKIEYKLINKINHGMGINKIPYVENIFGIYITKNEIIKNYEKDKNLFISKINNLTEMLTTPYCFYTRIWYKNYNLKEGYDYNKFENLINSLSKTTVKGILLSVQENENYEKDFFVEIIKK